MKTKLGLYIHVPFCKSKCSYCDFYSKTFKDSDLDNYVAKISEHIKFYGNISSNYIVDTIYIGGGTPSVLGGKRLSGIIKSIKKSFEISKDIEITCELNPESTDKKLLKNLRSVGVNRLSFGVQTSNDDKLKAISRLHTFDEARDVVELARKLKFSNISIDLIYGLENQTLEQVETDIENFLAINTEHISTYALKIEEGTPMFSCGVVPLDDDLVADMYDLICEKLRENGFSHYEISNFSKKGFESRHNMKYWNLSEYLGLGPSAHSFYGDARFSYASDIDKCLNDMEIDEKEDTIPFNTRFGEYIMLKLRTAEGISSDEFYHIFKVDFAPYVEKSQKFIDNSYAKYENGTLSLTEKGFFISNYIISEICN